LPGNDFLYFIGKRNIYTSKGISFLRGGFH
jgi:hypothetical protein